MTDSTQNESVFANMVVKINSQLEPEDVIKQYGHLTIKKILEEYTDRENSDND